MSKPLIILGAGGHASVCADLLRRQDREIIGYCSPVESEWARRNDLNYLGTDDAILRFSPSEIGLVNGIGSIGATSARGRIFEQYRELGYRFSSLIHDTAVVSEWTELAEGVQIMAGAILQAGCIIGINSIINTKASVDHDCKVGSHVHISPGSILCGGVSVGDYTHIGAGATVIQSVSIGSCCMVGAGSVVIRQVVSDKTVYGVPAEEA